MVRKLGFLPVLILLSFFALSLFAQDTVQPQGRLRPSTDAHTGSSPFSPPDEEDTLFTVDSGSGLDTGCTYRSGGPLRINVRVKRVVGDVGGDGYLTDAAGLVSRGLLSPRAKIILPAYDIDVNGAPGYPPEVDRISFNGHDLGTLSGDNGIWKLNSFEVPIEWVKFPARNTTGAATPANNEVRIDIDQASGSEQNWCMSVDWVQLQFSAVAPILLLHGTNAKSDTWEPDFTTFFTSSRAPFSNDINLTPNGAILANGRELSARVRALAAGFGAKKIHLICHSKGGLDTRAYLNNNYEPGTVKVVSVTTLSTPHHGTIVSDIIVAGRTTEDPESSDPDITYLIDHDYWFLSTPQPPAITDQMTASMARFNATYPSIPSDVKFYNYGADADLDDDGAITATEALPMIPAAVPDGTAAAAATTLYTAIGSIASISITPGTRGLWGLDHYTSVEVATSNDPFHENDLVTSVPSAHAPGGTYLGTRDANHSSIKSQALARTILNRIKSDDPIR